MNLRLHPARLPRGARGDPARGPRRGVARRRRPASASTSSSCSANPTGPVTVASGRNAILGDAVARLLEAHGHRVTREYYINDRGNQVRAFAESVRAAADGREPPEDGYKGAYVGSSRRGC